MSKNGSTSWEDQRTPALAIVARGDQITTLVPNRKYMVHSQSQHNKDYTIFQQDNNYSCSCDHHKEAGRDCIHILAVKFQQSLKDNNDTILDTTPVCDKCGSHNIVKNGMRHNKSGVVCRFLCKDCGFRFTDKQGFRRRRSDPEKIALALDLYFRGLSVRKVAEHFKQVYNLDVSHMTIYRWVEHYSRLAANWMNHQQVQTGTRWHIDETVVKVDGKARYLWNVLDGESRFLLATHVSDNRSLANTRKPMKNAKKATSNRPTEVFTDGMQSYAKAVRKEFGSSKKGVRIYWSPHVRVPSIRAKESNNLVERLHGTEKERVKVMRGFDKDMGCASLMEGFRVHYNMVKNHQGLGVTPGESAGIGGVDGFRWLNILQKATS